jgi:hypothetical protein
MSHTFRRDTIDHACKRKSYIIMGTLFENVPTPRELWRAHRDAKKTYKPGRRGKEYVGKGEKARIRRQLDAVVKEPEDAPMPRIVRHHAWDWN